MIGMNLMFHVMAALGLLLLIFLLLKTQRQRDLLRRMITGSVTGAGGAKKVELASPLRFLRELAAATGISLEVEGDVEKELGEGLRRIDVDALADLFLSHRVRMIRCGKEQDGPVIRFFLENGAQEAERLAPAVSAALGGHVAVKIAEEHKG